MEFAVLELRYFQRDFFRGFFRFFFHGVKLGSELLVGENLLLELPRAFGVFMKPIVHAGFYGVDYPGTDLGIAELVLRLAFEYRRLKLDRDRRCGFPRVRPSLL